MGGFGFFDPGFTAQCNEVDKGEEIQDKYLKTETTHSS